MSPRNEVVLVGEEEASGRVITFKYYGLTKKGKPRFPVYPRIRIN